MNDQEIQKKIALVSIYAVFAMIWLSWLIYALIVIAFPQEAAVTMAVYAGSAFVASMGFMLWAGVQNDM